MSNIKVHGVSEDYLFCKLFPHSLAGDATHWLKQLQPGSLTCWSDIKSVFLNNFFDDARTEEFRNKIYNFSQGTTETFKASWLRFRAYQRDCPHHGFPEIQLLNIFFRGLDWTYQATLDAASQGNFKTKTPEEATRLIENVASSTSAKKTDLERRKMAENSNGDRISEVKETSDSVHAFVIGDEQVRFTDESQTFLREGDEEEHVDLIDETGFRKQRLADQQRNMSFTRTYKAEQTHKSKLESMMEQVLKGQQKMSAVLDERLDSVYADLHDKFETLSDHVTVSYTHLTLPTILLV